MKYYRFLVEQFSNESWESKLPRHLPCEKFIFIDTVVSGRAICELFDAFGEEGLDASYFILILDRDGSAIEPRDKAKIDEMVALRRCTLITVKHLFTEDRGPAVSGIWSTVYPEFMARMRDKHQWAAESYGAGSYYIRVANNLAGMNNAGYNLPVTVINGSIRAAIAQDLRDRMSISELLKSGAVPRVLEEQQRRSDFFLGYFAHDLIGDIKKYRPFDRSTTLKLAEPRVRQHLKDVKVDVSSSHLVRVSFPEESMKRHLASLSQCLASRSDVFVGNEHFINP